eukprot:CAMPEP_0197024438 /NCGR_PEP_ID=MMETSP1384-20130603/4973_1 /TAXON_ID=29189 /ORGANISM="Ammonia sp." /LENGTH=188 /DNA_ID=CAMNT_0042452821 /DNA_START=72 /DNA_END=638 /DNA_ORIENTATION=-
MDITKPTITVQRRRSSKPKSHNLQQLLPADELESKSPISPSIEEEVETETAIYPSGAVLNPSVNLNQKAIIPSSRRKRARSHDTKLLEETDHSASETTDDEDAIYSSGAVSTHTAKPKITRVRRAKSHSNVMEKRNKYNYDSIWTVQSDQVILEEENRLIDNVMDKPLVPTVRKQKSHHIDVNALISD